MALIHWWHALGWASRPREHSVRQGWGALLAAHARRRCGVHVPAWPARPPLYSLQVLIDCWMMYSIAKAV